MSATQQTLLKFKKRKISLSIKSTMSQVSKEQFPLRLSECKKPFLEISSSKNPSLISETPFIETQNIAVMAPAKCFVCNKEDKVLFMFPLDPSKLRRWCIILKCQIPGTDTGARNSGPRVCSDYFSPSDRAKTQEPGGEKRDQGDSPLLCRSEFVSSSTVTFSTYSPV